MTNSSMSHYVVRDSDLELEVHDTLRIPLADFITASMVSLLLWSMIGWTVWAVVS